MGEEEEQGRPGANNGVAGGSRGTPMSQTQFLSWKRQKDAEISRKNAEAARKRAEDIAAGVVQMNGRELFIHEPWVFDNAQY